MPINDAPLRRGLVNAANIFATNARKAASSKPIPSNISNAIEVGTVSVQGSSYRITVSVNLKKAPAAAAYEFGSGLHRTDMPDKYIIRPKEKNALAFEWNPAFTPWGSKKFIGISSQTGKYLFRYVEHPGVEARPYMKPALEQSKPAMLREIGRPFAVEVIHKSIREIWDVR